MEYHRFFALSLLISLACTVIGQVEDISLEDEYMQVISHGLQRSCPTRNGRFANPDNCGEFFECRSGQPNTIRCRTGQLYDDQRGQCDDHRRVYCGHRRDRSSEENSSSEEDSREKVRCRYSNGLFAHRECNKYVICKNNKAKVYHCKSSEYFDDRQRHCRDKRHVRCDGRIIPGDSKTSKKPPTTMTPKPTTPEEVAFKCPRFSGTFPHPVECSKYYLCKYGIHVLLECRGSDLYDERERQCRHKREVRCGGRLDRDQMKTSRRPITTTPLPPSTKGKSSTTPESTTTTTEAPTTTPQPTTTTEAPTTTTPQPTTTTPEPTTTTPEPTTTPTPEPTTTSTPEPTTTPTPEPTTTPTPEPTTTPTTEPTTTPTPEPTTTPTPEPTTAPTPEPTTTTSPQSTTTESTIVTEVVTKPNTPPATDCDEEDLDCIIDGTGDVDGWFDCPEKYGHFPHGSSRQLFIHCDNGKPFIKTCPDKTVFDPTTSVCVWM